MRVKGMLMRKNPSIESQECIIEKLIVLPDEQFRNFKNHLLDEWSFISDNKLYMYCERIADGVYDYHSLLVMGENDEDGVIVESEGADYARYTSYLPEARTFIKGKAAWADVLNAKVESIYTGDYGLQIEVSGCATERLSEFSFLLAGYCSDKTYNMWVALSDEDSPMQME